MVKLKSIKGFRPNPKEFEKLQDDLTKLDVNYLLGKVERKTYLKKRNLLRIRFNKMKNTIK